MKLCIDLDELFRKNINICIISVTDINKIILLKPSFIHENKIIKIRKFNRVRFREYWVHTPRPESTIKKSILF